MEILEHLIAKSIETGTHHAAHSAVETGNYELALVIGAIGIGAVLVVMWVFSLLKK
jgi:hypothetical protein